LTFSSGKRHEEGCRHGNAGRQADLDTPLARVEDCAAGPVACARFDLVQASPVRW